MHSDFHQYHYDERREVSFSSSIRQLPRPGHHAPASRRPRLFLAGGLCRLMPFLGMADGVWLVGIENAWARLCWSRQRCSLESQMLPHTSGLATVPPCSAATYRIMRIPRIGGIYQLDSSQRLTTLLRHAAVRSGEMPQLATPRYPLV